MPTCILCGDFVDRRVGPSRNVELTDIELAEKHRRECDYVTDRLAAIAEHARAIKAARDRWGNASWDLAVRASVAASVLRDIDEHAVAIVDLCGKGET